MTPPKKRKAATQLSIMGYVQSKAPLRDRTNLPSASVNEPKKRKAPKPKTSEKKLVKLVRNCTKMTTFFRTSDATTVELPAASDATVELPAAAIEGSAIRNDNPNLLHRHTAKRPSVCETSDSSDVAVCESPSPPAKPPAIEAPAEDKAKVVILPAAHFASRQDRSPLIVNGREFSYSYDPSKTIKENETEQSFLQVLFELDAPNPPTISSLCQKYGGGDHTGFRRWKIKRDKMPTVKPPTVEPPAAKPNTSISLYFPRESVHYTSTRNYIGAFHSKDYSKAKIAASNVLATSKLTDMNDVVVLAQKAAFAACGLSYVPPGRLRKDLPKMTIVQLRKKRNGERRRIHLGSYKTAEEHSLVLNAVERVFDKYEKLIDASEEEIVSEALHAAYLAVPKHRFARAVCGDGEIEDGIIDIRVPGIAEKIESEFISFIKSFTNGEIFYVAEGFYCNTEKNIRRDEEKGSLVGSRNNLVLKVDEHGTGCRLRECDIVDVTNKKDDGSPPSTEILEYSFLNVLPFPNSLISLHYERKLIELMWKHTPGSAMNQINWGPNTDSEQAANHCVGLLVVHNARRLMEEKKIAFNRTSLESALSRLRENRKTEPFFTVEPYKQLRQKRSTKTAD